MDVKISDDIYNNREVHWGNPIYVSRNSIKSYTKKRTLIYRGKRIKPLNEVKPVENISKKHQSFQEIRYSQKEAPTLHTLQGYAYK